MNYHDRTGASDDVVPARSTSTLSEEEQRIFELQGIGDLPPFMSVVDFGKLIGVSKSKAYNMRTSGTINALKLDGRYIVMREEVFRLILTLRSASLAS